MAEQAKGQWWQKGRLAKDLPFLRQRAPLKQAISGYFTAHDFLEIETPALQLSPGMEPHIGAFESWWNPPGQAHLPAGKGQKRYLHTSPEFAMKKLLAGGLDKIYQFAPVWRNGEGSSTHHPQFTMLEWYRAAAPNHDNDDSTALTNQIFEDVQALCALAHEQARNLGHDGLGFQGKSCSGDQGVERLCVFDAFQHYCAIDLDHAIAGEIDEPDPAALAAHAKRLGIYHADDDRFEDIFFRIFAEKIEPYLGFSKPVWLENYPISMAALARPLAGNKLRAERFELYLAGLEIANGFGELTDPHEQKRRFMRDQKLKQKLYGISYPIDDDLLEALPAIHAASGIALGFDRLVMLAGHADHIHQTLWGWME